MAATFVIGPSRLPFVTPAFDSTQIRLTLKTVRGYNFIPVSPRRCLSLIGNGGRDGRFLLFDRFGTLSGERLISPSLLAVMDLMGAIRQKVQRYLMKEFVNFS